MLKRLGSQTPVTALNIVELAGRALALAGSGGNLIVSSLDASFGDQERTWRILRRQRIHKLVVQQIDQEWACIVLGGKEAVLLHLLLDGDSEKPWLDALDIQLKQRFALEDWCFDAAFVSTDQIIFASAHNSVYSFKISLESSPNYVQTAEHVHEGKVRPVLWSASFNRSSYKDITKARVAAGSMLAETILWDLGPSVEGNIRVLSQHSGGVFNLAFSPSGLYLASASEDRSIQIWLCPTHVLASSLSTSNSSSATSSIEPLLKRPVLLHTLWGHKGRIWRLKWADESQLVSVAEDATCMIWTPDGLSFQTPNANVSCKIVPNAHDGRSLWAVSCYIFSDGSTVVLTGGADGGIRSSILTKRQQGLSRELRVLDLGSVVGKLRDFAVDHVHGLGKFCLVLELRGVVRLYRFQDEESLEQVVCFESVHLATPAVLRINLAGAWIFSQSGWITHLDLAKGSVRMWNVDLAALAVAFTEDYKSLAIYERKSSSISVLDLNLLLAAERGMPIPCKDSSLVGNFKISAKVRSLCFLSQTTLVAGDEFGAIYILSLDVDQKSCHNILSLALHTKSVQDIRKNGSIENDDVYNFTTVGRDGKRVDVCIKSTATEDSSRRVCSVDRIDSRKFTFGVLEMILPNRAHQDTIINRYVALVNSKAVLVDLNGSELLSFSGANLQTPFQMTDDLNSFTYYRLVSGSIQYQQAIQALPQMPRPVIRRGLHGREILCAKLYSCLTSKPGPRRFLATAAENASLKIVSIDDSHKVRVVYTESSMAGVVKSLKWSNSAKNTLLFAGGTRELLSVWSFDAMSSPNEVRVEQICSAPRAKGIGEVRIMAMDVIIVGLQEHRVLFVGYSDGSVRIWLFDRVRESWYLLACETLHTNCVLSLGCVRISPDDDQKSRVIVVSGVSDGEIVIWDASLLVESLLACEISSATVEWLIPSSFGLAVLVKAKVHQSGVNGLDLTYNVSSAILTVATSGDDNAVNVLRYKIIPQQDHRTGVKLCTDVELPTISLQSAHASTIQGISFINDTTLVSSSVDQRLNVYRLVKDQIQLVDSLLHDVVDCSSMDWMPDTSESDRQHSETILQESTADVVPRNQLLVVAGIGIELIQLSLTY